MNAASRLAGPQAKGLGGIGHPQRFQQGVVRRHDLPILIQNGDETAEIPQDQVDDRVVAGEGDGLAQIVIALARSAGAK